MIKTKYAKSANLPVPDLQMYLWNTGGNFDKKMTELRLMNYAKVQWELGCGNRSLFDVDEVTHEYRGGVNQVLVILCGLHPKSVGYVALKSSDPMDAPLIVPNYFESQEDVEVVREGVIMGDRIMKTSKFQKKYVDQSLYCDGQQTSPKETLDEIDVEEMIRKKDPTAVVDSQLRVKNVKNLRVADGSVMPTLTSGNTQAPIAMIGERAAAFVLEKWKKK
ncbi:glucose dehydrogenase [Reticulomyxa filosa]|uniref:Glucose dehydrogenase n=1 Tax=Reticulomyxa filosa TaxID=46433 RepID=X6NWD1_RETFI|nr:glucose dehydrogenase [Reticulomyxa filosa]|eukprot:ETO30291.1 glucose dehydrogenase [Reticulomyxa filosa]